MVQKHCLAAVTIMGAVLLTGCRGRGPVRERQDAERPSPATLNGSQIADVQAAMARTLDLRGEAEQALRYYQEAVRKDPDKAEWWGRLAVLADKQGMFAESDAAHRRATSLQPTNADFHSNFGYSLYIQQRWEESGAALRQAIELKPDHAKAHNNLGLLLARTGGRGALESFQRAGCTKADAHANVAYALTLNGDFDNARREYEVALRHDPAFETARKGLENLTALKIRLGAPGPTEGAKSTDGEVTQVSATTGPTDPDVPPPLAPQTGLLAPRAPGTNTPNLPTPADGVQAAPEQPVPLPLAQLMMSGKPRPLRHYVSGSLKNPAFGHHDVTYSMR